MQQNSSTFAHAQFNIMLTRPSYLNSFNPHFYIVKLGFTSVVIIFPFALNINCGFVSSRERLRTKVTPDFHLTYSKNGGNLGLNQNDKNG